MENLTDPIDYVFKIVSKKETIKLKLVEAIYFTEENRVIESILISMQPNETENFNNFQITRVA